jgi:uncharacterized protein YbaR (Trm112 family)
MSDAMDAGFLAILVCPLTHQPLRELSAEGLAALNERIARDEVIASAGHKVGGPLDAALVTADGATAYPVRGGIPVLLLEEAIPLADRSPSPDATAREDKGRT